MEIFELALNCRHFAVLVFGEKPRRKTRDYSDDHQGMYTQGKASMANVVLKILSLAPFCANKYRVSLLTWNGVPPCFWHVSLFEFVSR